MKAATQRAVRVPPATFVVFVLPHGRIVENIPNVAGDEIVDESVSTGVLIHIVVDQPIDVDDLALSEVADEPGIERRNATVLWMSA